MRSNPQFQPTPNGAAERNRSTLPMRSLQFHAKPMLGLVLAVAASGTLGAEFEFRFWPAPGVESDPRFVRIDDGPCGQVATARVRSMPRYSKTEMFAPERVLELNAQGKAIRQWAIPVDAAPYALAGNDLLFEFDESRYKVSTTRAVSKLEERARAQATAPSAVQCVMPKEFGDSGYAGCWQFNDLRSGSKRVLAFEGVCT